MVLEQQVLVDKVIKAVTLDHPVQLVLEKVQEVVQEELAAVIVDIEEAQVEQVYYIVNLVLTVPMLLIVVHLRPVKDILHPVDLEEE
jgi:hypothetical protein